MEDPLAASLKDIGGPLEEQHPEDVLFELRGIHLAAQDVGCGEEMSFELRKGKPTACKGTCTNVRIRSISWR